MSWKLVELVLVFGGILAFGWWQLRSTNRDIAARKAREAREWDEAPSRPTLTDEPARSRPEDD